MEYFLPYRKVVMNTEKKFQLDNNNYNTIFRHLKSNAHLITLTSRAKDKMYILLLDKTQCL